MTTAALAVFVTVAYLATGFCVASMVGRRLRRIREARELWHREYWQREKALREIAKRQRVTGERVVG